MIPIPDCNSPVLAERLLQLRLSNWKKAFLAKLKTHTELSPEQLGISEEALSTYAAQDFNIDELITQLYTDNILNYDTTGRPTWLRRLFRK